MRPELAICLFFFGASLGSVILPALAVAASIRRARAFPFFWIPVAIALQFCFFALGAAALHGVVPNGWLKLGFAASAAGLLTCLTVRYFPLRAPSRFRVRAGGLALLVIAGVTAVLFSDVALVASRQGWGLEPDLSRSSAYFRPPFNSDAQRNVALVDALARGDRSPYLPGSKLVYQLFWYHFAALFVGWNTSASAFAAVSGCALATGGLVAFLMLWLLYMVRPKLAFGGRSTALALFLLFSHADVFHFFASWLSRGSAGIEADWSYASFFFRYFSFKLLLLTAPQHAAFFVPALLYFAVDRHARSGRNLAFKGLLVSLAVLASPVLSALLFPALWGWRAIAGYGDRREVGVFSLALLAAALAHTLLFGFPVWDLFLRPGTGHANLLAPAQGWWLLPLWALACGGALGVLACGLGWRRRFRRSGRGLPNPWIGTCLVGGIVFYYLLDEVELRRHFSMIVGALLPLGLWADLPPARDLRGRGAAAPLFKGCVVLAAVLHAYFLYCYLGKPSVLDPKVPWQDYFAMNERLKRDYPDLAVVAATFPRMGFVKPVALEAATSFADGISARVHGRVPQASEPALARAEQAMDVLPFALPLGYRALVWGPIEKQLWGARVRERFLEGSRVLATTGSVELYELADNFRDRAELGGLDRADLLREHGWPFEAAELYRLAVSREQDSARASYGLYSIARGYGRLDEAEGHLVRAVEIEPESTELRMALARFYRERSRPEEAKAELMEIVMRRPDYAAARAELDRIDLAAAGKLRN